MGVIIREMEADEAAAVQSLGLRTFLRSLETFFVPKPKTAKVAVLDDKIVGGFIYTTEIHEGKKFGVVDFFFVDSAHGGQGIGSELCKEGVAYLWSEGYDYLAAVVRDDNVASWAAFEKNGFVRANMQKASNALGFVGFLSFYIKHAYFVSSACDLYFAPRPGRGIELSSYSKDTGLGQITLHLFANLLLVFIFALARTLFFRETSSFADFLRVDLPAFSPAVLFVFGGAILFTYLGTLFSERKWHFRVPTGGFVLCFIVGFFGFLFPMGGSFYPDRYENTPEFRRDMGIPALTSWLYIMALLLVTSLFAEVLPLFSYNIWAYIGTLAGVLLIFRSMPLLHVSFGSSRVFAWNKILYGIMFLVSVLLLVFVW